MTTIGYATLQIIPTLDGVSSAIDKQLGGLKGVGRSAGKQLSEGVVDGVKSAESAIKASSDKIVGLKSKEADAIGKVRVAQEKLNDLQAKGVGGGRLAAAEEAREAALRKQATATRAVEAETRQLTRAQERLADAQKRASDGPPSAGGWLDKLKSKAESASESVRKIGEGGVGAAGGDSAGAAFLEGFSGQIGAIGTKAGPIGMAIAAAATVALAGGALIADQVLAGMDQQQNQANVQAKLGVDGDTMKRIADAAGKAYAGNFGESIAGNMDAAAAAIQSGLLDPNASADEQAGLIGQLDTVSSILGEEIPAVARAAQQAIRTGLAPDATAAFDLITKGQQAGLNVSQDWLDTITEYGTQFRKLGLDGPEAVGLLSQAVKGGARDTDVAADALKEFSIRAVDGSDTTVDAFTSIGLSADAMRDKFAAGGPAAKEALGQVLDGLRNVKDPAEQSRIAVELFGTQAEDLGGALNQFDLSTAVSQLGDFSGATQRAADIMGNTAAGSVESAKRSIETAVGGMQQSLASAFGPTLQQLATFITAHQGDITNFFLTVANVATEMGAGVALAIGGVVSALGLLVQGIGNAGGFVVEAFSKMVGAAATVADAVGQDGLAARLRDAQGTLDGFADKMYGAGDGIRQLGDNIGRAGFSLHDFDGNMAGTAQSAQNAQAQIQNVADQIGRLPGGKQIDISAIVTFKDTSGLVISPDQLRTPTFTPAVPGEARRPAGGGRAAGGAISGPGGPKSDIIPIWASNGEHMLDAIDVQQMGGQAAVYAFRSALKSGTIGKRATGGAIGPDVDAAEDLVGTPYSQGNRTDCSGMVARVINAALGQGGGLMSTKTAKEWLSARGFVEGTGGPGTIRVGWYDHGPNPNDGHMAMTLSDGRNAESGGSSGPFTIGGKAAGADSSQFDQHMYLPTVYGEGPAGSSSPFAGGSAAAAVISSPPSSASPSIPAPSSPSSSGAGGSSSSGSSAGSSFKLPSSFSDLAGLFTAGMGVTTKVTPDSPERTFELGDVAAEAVGGQVASALDVFGVGDAPGWLKAASTFVSGISIGGGSSSDPLSASSSGTGTPPPAETEHGRRAGQQPGPQVVYNVSARDAEGALEKVKRIEKERSAAKLDRF